MPFVFLLLLTISHLYLSFCSCYQTNEKISTDAFILSNGLLYRDILTLEASRAAAKFAHEYEFEAGAKPTERKETRLPDFVRKANFTFGERKSSDEIFDFLDSRFLNPPKENTRNRPTVVNITETEYHTNLYIEENTSTDEQKETHNVAANEGFDFNLQNLYPLVQLEEKISGTDEISAGHQHETNADVEKGSELLYDELVPRHHQDEKSAGEKLSQLENHLVSHGLNQNSVRLLTGAGFKSLDLLSLLALQDVPRVFPSLCGQQTRLLEICIKRLDWRPSYEVSVGLRRYLSRPLKTLFKVLEERENSRAGEAAYAGETARQVEEKLKAAQAVVEASRKVLECPVCYLTCPPPRIWQCNNGHLTCDSCHSQTRLCPLCRTTFSSVRPLAAERLAAELPGHCKNQSQGCEVSLPWAERLKHEAACPRSLGHCPVLSCPSLLPLTSIIPHLTSTHGWSEDFIHHKLNQASPSFSSSISTTTYLHTLQDQQNWWWGPQCISFDDQLFFLLISRKVEQPGERERGYFNFWVWLAGNSCRTEKYRYTINIKAASGTEEISYSARPVSLEVGLDCVREEQLSLLLSDGAVKRLVSNLERLHYQVTLEKIVT